MPERQETGEFRKPPAYQSYRRCEVGDDNSSTISTITNDCIKIKNYLEVSGIIRRMETKITLKRQILLMN